MRKISFAKTELSDVITAMESKDFKFAGVKRQGRGHSVFFWKGSVADIEIARFPFSKIRKLVFPEKSHKSD